MEFTCVGEFSPDKVFFLAEKPQRPTWPEFMLTWFLWNQINESIALPTPRPGSSLMSRNAHH